MRLKVQVSSASHSEAITGVDWLSTDEAISTSDDHGVWRWSLANFGPTPLAIQNNEPVFYTSLQLAGHSANDLARAGQKLKGASAQRQRPSIQPSGMEVMLLSASDGRIYLLDTSGKIERSIEAHKGAAILAKWSNAEAGGAGGFASCGEDGCVKIWSRNGMLRSVLVQVGKPIYALDWNGDSSKLAYCVGGECFIKLLNAQTSPIKWRAHTGLVLCLSWSSINDQIATGGEDCRYRLWDGQGRPLWSSVPHSFPITSLKWSPNGKTFAVGAFNLLLLCDKSGWYHSLERPSCGSIYCLSWSSDSTQLLGGCASGQLLYAQITEKRLMWEQLEAVQTRKRIISVWDLSSEVARERLETRDRVIRLELGYNFLIVATTKQCYIFSAKNWNTPVITDLKQGIGTITLIRLCEKCFMLVDSSSVQILSYDGRTLCRIRLSSVGNVGEPYNEQTAAISSDLVVLRDGAQHSLVHLFDPQTGRITGDGEIKHNANIVEVCVNQCGPITDRRVAFADENGDCFLALPNCYGAPQRVVKIGALISCLSFNTSTNMLAAFEDNHRLVIWAVPTVTFLDRDLLQPTRLELGNGVELGRSSAIVGFVANTVTVRRSDGCLIAYCVPPFVAGLIRCAQKNSWEQAVRICRTIKEDFLWAALAGLAAEEKNFHVVEICYGQLREAEKVLFLADLRTHQPNSQMRACRIAQFLGHAREAESCLIKGGRYFQAIMLHLGLFRFDKALELALKCGDHMDTVLGYRQRYLNLLGRKENDPKFLKHLSKVEIDWPHIFEKIGEDELKEQRQLGLAGGLTAPN